MDTGLLLLTAGGLTTLLLEGVKWILRSWILKDPAFDFPAKFYGVAIPVLNVLVVPLLAILEVEGYTLPTDWIGWARGALLVLISSLITLVAYNDGLQPLKVYAQSLKNNEVGG